MQRQAFKGRAYELRKPGQGRLSLEPVDASIAPKLAQAIAAIDPWRTLGIEAARLGDSLLASDDHLHRWVICRDGAHAGAVMIRSPWLFGPYLALLAVLPGHQGAGVGAAVLDWMELEARGTATNIWACVSGFNTRAQQFYEKHGFERMAVLDDLVRPGFAEVLIRKRLT